MQPSSGYANTPAQDVAAYRKWFGVAPVGHRPLPSKQRYMFEIFCVLIAEYCLWGAYRYFSAPYIGDFGTYKFLIAHIIFAPTLPMIPIFVYWKWYRREPGLPFRFTRMLLLSGVIVGLLGAIIWEASSMLISDAVFSAAGMTEPGTFTFFSFLDTMTMGLFALMTFVQFFVVGPAEELEFRGFVYDQSSRVLSINEAWLFSSIMFGLSHIPIAIIIYKMTFGEILVAELGWMCGGAVFGALYMWSRNIFAGIVMHGMGNWMLSVYLFQSTTDPAAGSGLGGLALSSLVTAISAALIISIFYLVFRYYWQPVREGRPILGGKLDALVGWVRDHDLERKPLVSTVMAGGICIILMCAMVTGITAAAGETDLTKLYMSAGAQDSGSSELGDLVEEVEVRNGTGSLEQGAAAQYSLDGSSGAHIRSATLTVTWTDEADIQRVRTYQNQPDTFGIDVSGPDVSASQSAANPQGAQGSVTASVALTDEMLESLDAESGYNITFTVTMVEAGGYTVNVGPGIIGYSDTGNDYEFQMEIVWLVPAEPSE